MHDYLEFCERLKELRLLYNCSKVDKDEILVELFEVLEEFILKLQGNLE